ncbi:MAG: hypothetical protein WDZ76_00780 [Pseudohongiellaceae bacterium]
MSASRYQAPISLVIMLMVLPTLSSAQRIEQAQQIWSADVIKARGQPVIPLFDGWFTNADGTHSLCYGYFNLNSEQALDIPQGEGNRLSDDRFSAMLPTYFEPVPPRYRHRFCVFTVQVPADFGRDEKIVWSLTSAGETLSVPGHIMPAFVLDEPASDGRGDIAPAVRLSATGPAVRGRVGITAEERVHGWVGEPVTFDVWVEHPDDTVWLGWAKHSGPGEVVFQNAEFETELNGEPLSATAVFSTPGDYVIRMQTIDDTAAFEFYCCHTNAYFNVTIRD